MPLVSGREDKASGSPLRARANILDAGGPAMSDIEKDIQVLPESKSYIRRTALLPVSMVLCKQPAYAYL